MASWDAKAPWAALCAMMWVTVGCDGSYTPYPPPQDYPTVAVGAGVGVGVGAGGSGGAASWSGNVCECAFEYTFNGPCGECFNNAISSDQQCKPAYLQCGLEPMCLGLVNCPGSTCYSPDGGAPGPDEVSCVQGCYQPFAQDTAHSLFRDVMSCACAACAAKCAPSQSIPCDTGGASGGSGGGSGGTASGGSGGTASGGTASGGTGP